MGVKPRRIVLALGGNAISSGAHGGNVADQFAQSRITAQYVADLVCAGHHLLLTHGNGPQVGVILRRVELSRHEVYPIDLGLAVADSQAGMGYMICQCIRNELRKRHRIPRACSIITTVLVDPDDPAFERPTKPIGETYDRATIEERIASDGWDVVEIPGKGFRRVVPSPIPRKINERDLIHELFDQGRVVVCCGGGGIPIIDKPGWGFEGVEAVIDKDLTAALLAVGTLADTLAILTAVDRVCLNYGTPQEQPLDVITVSQARAYLAGGQFPPGSMGPKIQACINFLEDTREPEPVAVITSIAQAADALAGKTGTRVVRD
jgi:carbamate kinase